MKELKLSPDCIITNGFLLTSIMDLRRQTFYSIPTGSDFIEDVELQKNLVTEEILLNIPDIELLPLNEGYEKPSFIDVLLIENYFNNEVIIHTVDQFLVNRIGFILDQNHLNRFYDTIQQLVQFDIEIIEVFIEVQSSNDELIKQIKDLITAFPVLFFNVFTLSETQSFNNLTQIRIINNTFTYRWRNLKDLLFLNFEFYFEALEFNVAYNKRLFIDSTGTFFESFHREINLGTDCTQINLNRLQEIWRSKKSDFDVCKSCELRLMCLDFRYPRKRPDNTWYHNEECDYNPFISKWSDEEGYKTLSECGIVSNADTFSIDLERIQQINEELWS